MRQNFSIDSTVPQFCWKINSFYEVMGEKKKALDEMEKKMQFGVLRTYVSMSHNI